MRKFKVTVDGKTYDVEVEEIKGELVRQSVPTQKAPSAQVASASSPPVRQQADRGIRAPMAGKILEVRKEEGNPVGPGEIVFVMESMKMEVYVKSSRSGKIQKIHAKAGILVEANALLAEVA